MGNGILHDAATLQGAVCSGILQYAATLQETLDSGTFYYAATLHGAVGMPGGSGQQLRCPTVGG